MTQHHSKQGGPVTRTVLCQVLHTITLFACQEDLTTCTPLFFPFHG